MKTAFLFTGQGFQYEGMLQQLPKSDITKVMLKAASEILGEQVCQLDSKEALNNNCNVQLCIYISEVILGNLQLQNLLPDYVAGHSIGAFAAATISGALEFEDGLQLVKLRGKAMEESYPKGYGMLAVIGLTLKALEREIAKINENINKQHFDALEERRVYIANINTREQMVLSGFLETLKLAEKYLKTEYAVKTQYLKVKVPSHCELMLQVSNILAKKMEGIQLKPPQIPYIMNTTARRTKQIENITKDLIFGVSNPVYWFDSLNILYELEVRRFLEISQSNVLTELGRKCYADAYWKNIN